MFQIRKVLLEPIRHHCMYLLGQILARIPLPNKENRQVSQYGETENLWLTGFPVYNNNAGAFQLLSAGGAYQVTFSTPVQRYTGSGGKSIDAPITLLGTGWTIINETPPTTHVVCALQLL